MDFLEGMAVFEESLKKHIAAVQAFGAYLEIDEVQLAVHDASKYEPEEFTAYARYYGQRRRDDEAKEQFRHAWLHHIHHNPHHWQHWIIPGNGYSRALAMPPKFVAEMVADWHGASFCYRGHWDISEWFNGEAGKMLLHDESWTMLEKVLRNVGYRVDTVLHGSRILRIALDKEARAKLFEDMAHFEWEEAEAE